MSYDRQHDGRKDHRQQYRHSDSRSIDRTCRSHGSCPHCRAGREYKHKRREPVTDNNETTEDRQDDS